MVIFPYLKSILGLRGLNSNFFVELEFFHSGDKVLDADDYRSKHWAARLGGDCKGFSDSQSGMIDKITPDLVDAGVTSIRFWADPSVDFAELTKGPGFVNFLGFNKEELPSGRVEPTGYGNADWASQRLIASDMIDFARDKNIIDQKQRWPKYTIVNRYKMSLTEWETLSATFKNKKATNTTNTNSTANNASNPTLIN